MRLAGAFGTFSPLPVSGLWATEAALRSLAAAVRRADGEALILDEPPPDYVETGPMRRIVVRDVPGAMVALRKADDVLDVAGGADARGVLAETLENLADCVDMIDGRGRPHVDIEPFPGHATLDEESDGITVLLVAG